MYQWPFTCTEHVGGCIQLEVVYQLTLFFTHFTPFLLFLRFSYGRNVPQQLWGTLWPPFWTGEQTTRMIKCDFRKKRNMEEDRSCVIYFAAEKKTNSFWSGRIWRWVVHVLLFLVTALHVCKIRLVTIPGQLSRSFSLSRSLSLLRGRYLRFKIGEALTQSAALEHFVNPLHDYLDR